MYLIAEPPERKPRAQLTEKAPNPPSFCRKKVPSFVLGRRWSPAPAGKFSPHAGAATHGNGISKLATHPPQHADAPSLQLAAVVLSPFPSHRRGHESAAAFSRSAPRRGAPRQAIRRPAASAGKFSPHARPPRPGLSVSHHARRPLVPGAHAWRKLSPYAAAAMVVSDELPKAPSKERGKSEFFFGKSELVTRK